MLFVIRTPVFCLPALVLLWLAGCGGGELTLTADADFICPGDRVLLAATGPEARACLWRAEQGGFAGEPRGERVVWIAPASPGPVEIAAESQGGGGRLTLKVIALAGQEPVWHCRVRQSYPHDPAAFTQGLVYLDGELFESTGLRGRSELRRVELVTGRKLSVRPLEERHFGEGLAGAGNLLYQITLDSGLGFVLDRTSFAPQREFPLPGAGWGLAWDGRRLLLSDGSARLSFLDPHSLAVTGGLEVASALGPVRKLNELEVVDGEVFANVWLTRRIARIDPVSGRVKGWIDLSGLLTREEDAKAEVANGIAWDAAGRRLFVTGKYWPRLFEVELVPGR